MRYLLIFGLLLLLTGCSTTTTRRSIITPETNTITKSESVQLQLDELSPHAYNQYVNALLYEGIGDLQKAAISYKKALQYHPLSYVLRYSLAETYYRLRDFGKTVKVLEVIDPIDEDVLSLLASSYMSLGEEDSTINIYRKLIELDPNNSTAFAYLAGYYQNKKDIDSLIWAYDNILRIRPENERNWRELGRLHAQKGDYQKSKESFKKSIEIDPKKTNLLSYISLGELYLIEAKPDSAKIIFETAHAIDPDNLVINREMTVIYLRLDSLAASLPYAQKVSALNPEDKNAQRRLAIIYYGLDSLEQAENILTDLVNSGDNNSINHYYLGRVAAVQENFLIAAEEFTIVTKMVDSSASSWLDLGFTYRKLKDYDKEAETYLNGLNHVFDEPGALKLMFSLGAVYEISKQYEKSIEVFEEIIARAPDYDQALNYLGYMLADKGERLEYALELIEKAVKLSPDNAAYLDSYGWVLYRLGKLKKAQEHLERASTLVDDPVIFDHLGDIYKAVGKEKEAVTWWQKALELSPDDLKIKVKLSE